jgi:hypothetical protein
MGLILIEKYFYSKNTHVCHVEGFGWHIPSQVRHWLLHLAIIGFYHYVSSLF